MSPRSCLVLALASQGCALQFAYQRNLSPDLEHPGAITISTRLLKGANRGPVVGTRATLSIAPDGLAIQSGALVAGYVMRPIARGHVGMEAVAEIGLGQPNTRNLRGTALTVGVSPSLFLRVVGADTRRRTVHLIAPTLDLVLGFAGNLWFQERVPGRACDGDCLAMDFSCMAGLRLGFSSAPFTGRAVPPERRDDDSP